MVYTSDISYLFPVYNTNIFRFFKIIDGTIRYALMYIFRWLKYRICEIGPFFLFIILILFIFLIIYCHYLQIVELKKYIRCLGLILAFTRNLVLAPTTPNLSDSAKVTAVLPFYTEFYSYTQASTWRLEPKASR